MPRVPIERSFSGEEEKALKEGETKMAANRGGEKARWDRGADRGGGVFGSIEVFARRSN